MKQTTENQTIRAISWQHSALSELVDLAANLLSDQYDSPADFSKDMDQRSEAIALVLDPNDESQLPTILDAVGSHVFALQLASEQLAQFSSETPDQIVGRLQLQGFDRFRSAHPNEVSIATRNAIEAMQTMKARGWVPTEVTTDEA